MFTQTRRLFAFLAFSLILNFSYAQSLAGQLYQEGVIYLKIQDNSTVALSLSAPTNSPEEDAIHQVLEHYEVNKIEKPFDIYRTSTFERIYKIYFPYENTVDDLMIDLDGFSFVEITERVPLHRTFDTQPNDPILPYQLPLINAYAAFDLHLGGNSIVAIVDDAVQTGHEDLAPNMLVGYNAMNGGNNPNPPFETPNYVTPNVFSHGTHVAGIAGAASDNGIGIASIGWNTKILPVRATNTPGFITNGPEGVAYAAALGANVINMSWGSSAPSELEYMNMTYAKALGAILVASAGNDNTILPNYPAAYGEGTVTTFTEVDDHDLIIAVGSIDADGSHSGFTNYGHWVDIVAYGNDIYSTVANSDGFTEITNEYGYKTGTSMSAPLVSGLLGLMHSYNTSLTNEEIISCLRTSANDDIYSIPDNIPFTNFLGAGRIDALAALECIGMSCAGYPIVHIDADQNDICAGETVTLTVSGPGYSYTWTTGATGPTINVNQPGTYAVETTYPGGCTAVSSITIYPAPTDAYVIINGQITNDVSLCENDIPVVLTANYGNAYNWNFSNGQSSTEASVQISGMPGELITYSVTVTDVGGCTGVDQILTGSVDILPLPTVTVDIIEDSGDHPNDGIICRGDEVTLIANGGVSFLWTTGETTQSITVSPTISRRFSVLVTDENGCSRYFEETAIIVEECNNANLDCPCVGNGPLTYNIDAGDGTNIMDTDLANLIEFVGDPATGGYVFNSFETSGICVGIKGKLIIGALEMNIDELKMQDGAEIVVEANTSLRLRGTQGIANITGCNKLWKGITVEQGAAIDISQFNVEDALFAINPANNAQLDVIFCNFRRNFIGIYHHDNGFNVNTLSTNTFDGTEDLLPIYDNSGSLPFTVQHRSFAGLYLRYNSSPVNPVLNLLGNQFSNMPVGAALSGGIDVIMQRNTFSNILRSSEVQYPIEGHALFLKGTSTSSLYHNNEGLGNTISYSNCDYGIETIKADTWIHDTRMACNVTGIRVQDGQGKINLHDNRIVMPGYGTGIQLMHNDAAIEMLVEKNSIRVEASPGDPISLVGGKGIAVHEKIGRAENATARIHDNIIRMQTDFTPSPFDVVETRGIGIYLNSTRNIRVIENTDFHSKSQHDIGILIQGGKENTLAGNRVTGGFGPGGQLLGTGLIVENATNNLYSCNTFYNLQDGTIFMPGTANDSKFVQNTFLPPLGNGLVYQDLLTINSQEWKENRWLGNSTDYSGAAALNEISTMETEDIVSQEFVVSLNTSSFFPPSISLPNYPLPDQPWFRVQSNNQGLTPCSFESVTMVPDKITKLDFLLASGYEFDGTSSTERRWLAERSLYYKLKESAIVLDNSPEHTQVNDFQQQADQGALAAYHFGETALASIFNNNNNSASWITKLDAKRQISKDLAAFYLTLDENSSTSDWDAYYSKKAALESIAPILNYLWQDIVAENNTAANAAQQIVSTLSPNLFPQEHQVEVSDFLLSIQRNEQFTASELDQLRDLADECPLTGGPSVHQARSLYKGFYPNYRFSNNCTGVAELTETPGDYTAEKLANTERNTESAILNIYPNPVAHKLAVTLPNTLSGDDSYLRLINALGVTVVNLKLNEDQTTVSLVVNQFSSGIYYLELVEDGQRVDQKKIIISH